MSVNNDTIQMNVKIPFKKTEPERFKLWLESTGRKAGPFLRVMAMNAVLDWEKSQSAPITGKSVVLDFLPQSMGRKGDK